MAPSGWEWNQPMNGALGYMMGGGSATFGSFAEFLGQGSPFSQLNNNSGSGGSGGGLSSTAIDNMFNIGGLWTNTGGGFTNSSNVSIGYNGSYQSLNTALDGYINIPEVKLSGSSFFWGIQAQSGFNSYMARWNTRSDFAWDRASNAGRYNDGSVKMMGGDMLGLTDLAGEVFGSLNPENREAALSFAALAVIATKGRALPGIIKGESNTLIHYTSEAGYKAIMESGQLLPSIGIKNARYGSGQYLTDLLSNGLTKGQVSRRLFGVPWNTKRVSHFIEIDVSGLNVIKNGTNNFLIPNNTSLPLNGIIINHGPTIFKP